MFSLFTYFLWSFQPFVPLLTHGVLQDNRPRDKVCFSSVKKMKAWSMKMKKVKKSPDSLEEFSIPNINVNTGQLQVHPNSETCSAELEQLNRAFNLRL